MSNLLVIVPSRGRPDVVHELAESVLNSSSADLVIGLDDDDEPYNLPSFYGNRLLVETNPRLRLGGTLNLLACKYANNYKYLAFMGDDHRPRTSNWDKQFSTVLDKLGTGFVYGNDLIWGEQLPTSICMTSNIVQKLGYMVPPGMIHMYLDNFWLELGRALNKITYLDDVIIEHLHPSVGKAQWTPEYQAVNCEEIYSHDRELFNEYINFSLAEDVKRLS